MTRTLKKRLLKKLKMLLVRQLQKNSRYLTMQVKPLLSVTLTILCLAHGMSLASCQKKPILLQNKKLNMTRFLKNCDEKIEAWHKYFDENLYLNFYMEPTPEEFRELVDCGHVMLGQFEGSGK